MAVNSTEHARTLAFAEIALGQIKALPQPAYLRNYEIWYTYATGYNSALNQNINEALAHKGTLSPADIDQIYDAHLSSTRLTERIDNVGAKVVDGIDQIMAMIDAASRSAANYGESLATVSQKLGAADRDGLRTIIESLVVATKDMEKTNQAREARLKASKHEISQLQNNLEAVRNESLTDPLTTLANRPCPAITVGDHIRCAVMGKELMKRSTGKHLGRITISVGVALFRRDDTAQSLIGRADAGLYAAKRNGRNRVICETDPEVAQADMAAA